MVTSEVLSSTLYAVKIGDDKNQRTRIILQCRTEAEAYIIDQIIRDKIISIEVVA